jgi:hypothetical protein
MKTNAGVIDTKHFSKDFNSLLLDESEFTIGRKPQNGSRPDVSSATQLKSRNFNGPPNGDKQENCATVGTHGFCVTQGRARCRTEPVGGS